jgi:glycosyltransferase involved in cell wall biosynthesis
MAKWPSFYGHLAIVFRIFWAHALQHFEEIRSRPNELRMRAILLDRLPNVAIAAKANADRPLNGVKVNDAGLVQALLDYGSYDTYFYIREAADNRRAEAYKNGERLHALDLGSLESLRLEAPDELVLFTSSHHLAKFVPFRQFCGHMEWPICGLTHGLSANALIPSYSWNYFAAIESYDAIVCTSVAGRSALLNIFNGLEKSCSVAGVRGRFPPQMPWIPLGIEDSSAFESWHATPNSDNQGFVVLCIGRFTASHKADLRPLIAAFLGSNGLPFASTLILAGDDTQGHIASSLEEFSWSFSSPRKVVVMPDISDLAKAALLKSADVALCMSDTYQETFGLSVLEAMRADLPVVAPSWDGYRDLVDDGVTGFLVRTAVSPDNGFLNATSMLVDPAYVLGQRVIIDLAQMMDRLRLLSEDRARARRMGAYGKQRVETMFSWRSVIARYEKLWDALLSEGKLCRPASPDQPIGFLDYGEVFEGHPDNTLSMESPVRLRGDADERLALLASGQLFSPPPVAGFSDAMDQRILDAVRQEPAIALNKLIEIAADTYGGRSMATSQISRLAKYGLLSILPPLNAETYHEESSHDLNTDSALRPASV